MKKPTVSKVKRKTPAKKRRDRLDRLWADDVKLIAGSKCEYCSKTTTLNSHHIFGRSNFRLRWDVDNGMCLCAYHHMLGNVSAHKSPLLFAEFMIKERGQEWYASLLKKASPEFKLGSVDKSVVEEELQRLTKELNDG